tara:strand:+ start:70280 stop:70855 length:576 start_codon:yes stop_codon:yes gene_type:complete
MKYLKELLTTTCDNPVKFIRQCIAWTILLVLINTLIAFSAPINLTIALLSIQAAAPNVLITCFLCNLALKGWTETLEEMKLSNKKNFTPKKSNDELSNSVFFIILLIITVIYHIIGSLIAHNWLGLIDSAVSYVIYFAVMYIAPALLILFIRAVKKILTDIKQTLSGTPPAYLTISAFDAWLEKTFGKKDN